MVVRPSVQQPLCARRAVDDGEIEPVHHIAIARRAEVIHACAERCVKRVRPVAQHQVRGLTRRHHAVILVGTHPHLGQLRHDRMRPARRVGQQHDPLARPAQLGQAIASARVQPYAVMDHAP